jgi:hypothetical protein
VDHSNGSLESSHTKPENDVRYYDFDAESPSSIPELCSDNQGDNSQTSTNQLKTLQFRTKFKMRTRPPIRTWDNVSSLDFTPKALLLLKQLNDIASLHTKTSFRAMVFVSRRLNAKVLGDLINLVATKKFPHIRAAHITGKTSKQSLKIQSFVLFITE